MFGRFLSVYDFCSGQKSMIYVSHLHFSTPLHFSPLSPLSVALLCPLFLLCLVQGWMITEDHSQLQPQERRPSEPVC